MAVRKGWVIALLAFFVVAAVTLVGVGMWLGGKQVQLKPGSYLVLDLSGGIQEDVPSDTRGQIFYEDERTLWDVVAAVRDASADRRIDGILLKLRGVDWGWAKLEELRGELEHFQSTGKPVLCWLEGGDERDYYLGSVADEIYLPTGINLDLNGLAAYVTFVRGTFDKIGVVADFEHVGEYKDAAESMTRRGMSEPSREALTALVEDRYSNLLTAIASARGWPVEQAGEILDRGPFTAEEAHAFGLVDSLLFEEEVEDLLPLGRGGNQIALDDYVALGSGAGGGNQRIALVFATGTIISGVSGFDPLWGRTLGNQTFAEAIREARDDKRVRAIVLRVDSPGGDTYASRAMWREVREAASYKPVIASFSDLAASGGYYLAMGADSVVAQPGTITGSIGVLGGKFNLSGLYRKLGVDVQVLSRGRNAEFYSPLRNFTPAEREKYLAQLWQDYRQFVAAVAENRGRPQEEIESAARGRVWSGGLAYEEGLVDTLGGFATAIGIARRNAEIRDDERIRYVVYPRVERTLVQRLLQQMLSESRGERILSRVVGLDVLRSLALLADSRSLTWMPYTIELR